MSRLYRIALRMLPSDLRAKRGAEMAAVFDELLREGRATGGRAGTIRIVAAELIALARFAWSERRRRPARRRHEVPGSIEPRVLSRTGGKERPSILHGWTHDFRYAVRTLLRSPGFSFVAILTIALAIGPNAAIFSIVHRVLLAPLPYSSPERIYVLGEHVESGDGLDAISPGDFYDWQAGATGFESLAAFAYREANFRWNGNAERILGSLGTGHLFEVLGRRARYGRVFAERDDRPGAEPVLVLSAGLARRMFGRPDPVGESVIIDAQAYTVIGVMPEGFFFPDHDAEYWVPPRFAEEFRANRNQYFLRAVGRLRDGVGIDQAQAQLNVVMDAIRREHPHHTGDSVVGGQPLRRMLVWDVRERLLVLMAAVSLVLLVACANVGNLLLARASSRSREIAVRRALGARSGRLIRQLLTESLVLGAAGGLVGVVLARGMLAALTRWLSPDLPVASRFSIDPAVLGFTAAISLLAAVVFGLVPALHFTSSGMRGELREGRRTTAGGGRLRSTLVAAEIALALVLLAGAGLLVRSFDRLLGQDLGFPRISALTFEVNVRGAGNPFQQRHVAFFDTLRQRLAEIPGVESVAMSSTLPVAGQGSSAWFNLLDRPTAPDQTPPAVPYRAVDPDFFRAMGIPLLRGRFLEPNDSLESTRAVVISRSVAERFWSGEDPIGKKIYLGAPEYRLFPDGVVVGVVGDVKQSGLTETSSQAVYFTHRTAPYWSQFSFALRTSMDPEALAPAARSVVRELDPTLPITNVRSMGELVEQSAGSTRLSMALVSLFAMLTLGLAVVGVYGVLSWSVGERRSELGIRMALGATAMDIRNLVLRSGMLPVLAGVAIGLAGALLLTRFLESLLFGVTPTDPAAFAAATALLIAVAGLASWIPARRATRQDPAAVLRHE